MKVAIVVTLCHALLGQQPNQQDCRDEVALETHAMGLGCLIGEAQVIEWKTHSIYAGEQWEVHRPRCVPGGYRPKESI